MLVRNVCCLLVWAWAVLPASAGTPAVTEGQLRVQLRRATTDSARGRLWQLLALQAETDSATFACFKRSLAYLRKAAEALPPAAQAPVLARQAEVLEDLGDGHAYVGQYAQASAYLQQSVRLWERTRQLPEAVNASNSLLNNYYVTNNHPAVIRTIENGRRLVRQLPPTATAIQTGCDFLTTAAQYYDLQGEAKASSLCLLEARHLLRRSHDSAAVAASYAIVYRAAAKQESNEATHLPIAVQLAQRSVNSATALGDSLQITLSHYDLGILLLKTKQWDAARTSLRKAVAYSSPQKYGNVYWAQAMAQLAGLEQGAGHPDLALGYIKQIEAQAGKSLPLFVRSKLAQVRADSYHATGQDKLALAAYKEHISARDSLSTEKTRRAALLQRLTEEQRLREAALKDAQRQEQRAAAAEIQRQRELQWLIGIGAAAVLIIGWLLYREQRARQRAEAARERQRVVDLQALDHARSEFFVNISHEFRTPLTLVMGPADALATDEAESATARQTGARIGRQARRLLSLTTRLLDLSKLEVGALQLQLTSADATLLTRTLVEAFAPHAEAKGVRLETDLPATLPLVLDASRFDEMLGNLLANAIRYTPAGGRVQVALAGTAPSAAAPAGGVAWTVTDTGPGIAPDRLPQLFARFYQVPDDPLRASGTGIGLALVRELTRLHGGDVSVSSTLGQGASFCLWLPLGLTATSEAATPSFQTPALFGSAEEESSVVSPATADAPVVLLIEDHAEVRAFLRQILAPQGYQILEAPDGPAGLALAREHVPDLIISDVMMPGLDGYGVVRALRAEVATSHIPVVLLTARAAEADRLAGLRLGATAYLTKPFSPPELLAQVESLLALRAAVQARFAAPVLGAPVAAASEALSQTLPASDTPPDGVPTALQGLDRQFVERVQATVLAHLADELFGVDQLADAVALSRAQLHRKLKALTGQAPGEYLRLTRLYRALELLQTRAGNVAEVAYQVGFASPAHFSTAFTRQFGFAPSTVYRQQGAAEAASPEEASGVS